MLLYSSFLKVEGSDLVCSLFPERFMAEWELTLTCDRVANLGKTLQIEVIFIYRLF